MKINITLAAAEIIRRWDELGRDGLENREASLIGIMAGCKTATDGHRWTQMDTDEKMFSDCWPLQPERQRSVLLNAHRLLRRHYKKVPLWSFISDITAHGSGYSRQICEANGWNPSQDGSLPLN